MDDENTGGAEPTDFLIYQSSNGDVRVDEIDADGNISKIYYCSSEWKRRNELKTKQQEQQPEEQP